MKRPILRALLVAVLDAGGLLAVAGAANADSGSPDGTRITYIYQHTTTICGNAIAVEAVVRNHCGAYTTDVHPADFEVLDGIFDLNLDYDGTDVDDDAGQWFHIRSRTWS
ncbi:hypothetical protein GCM10009557_46320 [Virgisporangium ochraceum]